MNVLKIIYWYRLIKNVTDHFKNGRRKSGGDGRLPTMLINTAFALLSLLCPLLCPTQAFVVIVDDVGYKQKK